MATQDQIGKLCGVKKQAVQQWVAKGCDISTPESVLSWLSVHGTPGPTKKLQKWIADKAKEKSGAMPDAVDEVEKAAEAPVPDGLDRQSLLDMLERTRDLSKHAAKMSKEADLDDDARKWATVSAQLSARQLALEKEVRRMNHEDQVTLRYEEARAVLGKVLNEVKTLCDNMPVGMGAKVNPNDPELAIQLLTDWRDNQLYKVIHGRTT